MISQDLFRSGKFFLSENESKRRIYVEFYLNSE
jgi:hypothetical protein